MKRIIWATAFAAVTVSASAADLNITFDAGLDARFGSFANKIAPVWDGNRNHTPGANPSGSLRLQRTPTTMETRGRISEMDGITSRTVISLWFYDDGDDIKYFNLMLQTDGESHRIGIGLDDSVVGEDAPYFFSVNGSNVSTGVMRSVGWHKAEFGFIPGTGVEGRVDGNGWVGNTFVHAAYPDWFHFRVDSGTGANNIWVDDITLEIGAELPPQNSVDSWMDY